MDDVYVRLAKKLDAQPNGFPATGDGVELKILRKIFSPEEAAMALRLKPLPETADAIASRLRLPVDEMRRTLDRMAERGEISAFRMAGQHLYMFVPFVVGIYEFQVDRMDKELAELFEAYLPTLMPELGGKKPPLARVVPVNAPIQAKAEVLPHEDVRAMLAQAKAFRVAECICRKEKGLLGHPCSHTLETCMSFSREENAYEGIPPWGREVSREQALAVIDTAEREGLVHCTYNSRTDPFFVCNCCSCCCGFLRAVKEFGAPYALARSNYVSRIEASTCTTCGECASPRCPMDAIAASDGVYRVDEERCIGCGACAAVCPADAIALEPRPLRERTTPPKTVVHWSLDRATERKGALYGLALRGWLAWEVAKAKLAR